jgi:methylmalonyl-CoA mutase N-terminal domain/subunit
LETQTWRRPELTAKLAARERATLHMIAELSGTLSPAQRGHLQRRIAGYVQDITRLASSD